MEKVVIAKWRVKASSLPRILERLPELAAKTREEKGNVSYVIYQSESDPNELILHEQYVDAEAADAHRQSEHYQKIVVGEIVPHLEGREVFHVQRLI
jgi:quinol monooxygenase YgiN